MISNELLKMLACPVSQQPLSYHADQQELICEASGLAYPIIDGIPQLLLEAARKLADSTDKTNESV